MKAETVGQVVSPERQVLFVAAGFEDRSKSYLAHCHAAEVKFRRVVVVSYKPSDPRNKLAETIDFARKLSVHTPAVVEFDRYRPGASSDVEPDALGQLCGESTAVIDISGMSRFLVVVLTVRLARLNRLSYIVYTEPALYMPTKEEFQRKLITASHSESLMFLTTGLSGLTTVPDLTTATMQGYPELLVASPTFEPAFLRALINELSPSRLILLEGVPPSPENAWRRQAVRDINDFAFTAAKSVIPVSTDSISEVEFLIGQIYDEHKYTHRLIVAPAASKLNAVGIALAIVSGAECEVIYPTPAGFSEPYTEGEARCIVYQVAGETQRELEADSSRHDT